MTTKRVLAGFGLAGAMTALLALSPAQGTQADKRAILKRVTAHEMHGGIGSFTPASADPRLAAAFARTGIMSSGFRFTPSGGNTLRLGKGVTVAVRARSSATPAAGVVNLAAASPAEASVAPVAYNLGASVGWKKFAISGDYAKTDLGLIQGGREGADIGISFNARKWSSRIAVAADRPAANAPAALGLKNDVSVDLGGSYRLTKNLDVTAGVRYKREFERLETFADTKRDSQAVYVGTQFKF
jgi:hypothetical protein